MIIIGEKINSSIPAVKKAIDERDVVFIQDLAIKQDEIEVDYIDVNAGALIDHEIEGLEWLIDTVQAVVDTPLVIDSPSPKAIRAGLERNKKGRPIINSISAEKERFDTMMPLIKEYNPRVVAMAMDDRGMPDSMEMAFENAVSIIELLGNEGIKHEDIFVDPLIRPVGADDRYGRMALETIRSIRLRFPNVHITCGLSNISFGIPARKIMNQTFLVAAMTVGLDSAIMDPLSKPMQAAIASCEALLGLDEYCGEYIAKYREGTFDF